MKLAAGIAFGVLALPASASAVGFGPDLNRVQPLSPAQTCADIGRAVSLTVGSCMVAHQGTHPDTLTPPTSGIVTRIRVKVGGRTGPMRVNVLRFLFQQTGAGSRPVSAGPFLQSYGPQFTPRRNAITEVRVDVPVFETLPPPPEQLNAIQVIDTLALEVLAPDVPVPLFPDPGVLTYPIAPGPTILNYPAPSPNAMTSYTNVGFGVLMNGDLVPKQTRAAAPALSAPGRNAPLLPLAMMPMGALPLPLPSA